MAKKGGGRTNLLRLTALCGTAAPILMAVLWTTAILLRPGYDPMLQYGSELGQGSNAWIQNTNFAVTGFLIVMFSLGLQRTFNPGRGSRLGPGLLLLFGACELATGFLPCDPACPIPGTSLSQSIHNLLAVVAFVTLPLAPLTLSALFKKDRLWIPVTAYSRATGIVTFCLSAVFLAGSFAQASWKGLAEILLVAVPFLWIETVASRMFKQLKPARG